ncbi:MAG: Phthiotriol/phenolphthiotriol dimycocerosates methyltransferase [Syntrophorhabdus sp. PtaU1.Bin153]|nr:MAG: Phthiotriol/phenolphthiotriol dimycocerosates methyltransferase [Syntrophorhabdus sp. PtaU1.Bin153]
MKLNWAERWVVNNPLRTIQQGVIIRWMRRNSLRADFSRALEVGCGRGSGARIIMREFQPLHMHIMDLDMEMIRRTRRYISPAYRSRICPLVEDLSHLPYRASSFDAVFGFGVLHHIEDWQGALSEIARVLKPGGSYFMEELYPSLYQNFITKWILLHPQGNRFRSEDLRKALALSGLSMVAEQEAPGLYIIAVCRKQ